MKKICTNVVFFCTIFGLFFFSKKAYSKEQATKLKLIPGNYTYDKYMDRASEEVLLMAQRSLLRSLLCPGLGQAMNGKFIRTSIIWGSLVAFLGGAYYCHKEYMREFHASGNTDYAETYKKVRTGFLFASFVCYILNAVDAYVSSKMLTYDISDDVSVKIVPKADVVDGVASLGISTGFYGNFS